MSALPEVTDSLKERARRVLLDNPEPPAHAAPDTGGYADQVELRLRAIRLVRDMEPKRTCYGERVRDLSRSLVETSGDSIHYRALLDKLREAHEEWLRLEERLWAASYIIRSTQWLVDLLADPTLGVSPTEQAAAARDPWINPVASARP